MGYQTHDERRTCVKCNVEKSIEDFYKAGKWHKRTCKCCDNVRFAANSMARRAHKPWYELLRGAKNRAMKKGLPYDLDSHSEKLIERIMRGKCEVTGFDLDFSVGTGRSFYTPSIDRIAPEKGYLYDNVRVICWGLNAGLGNWGEDLYIKTAVLLMKRRSLCNQESGH